MNRREAEDFVYKSYMRASKHQPYAALDSGKRRPDLTKGVIERAPHTPSVVVTGSKGKGSVAEMISQILQTCYRVGLYTSPHITDFCERFKVDGENISDDEFAAEMTKIAPVIDGIDASLPDDVCISPIGIQALLAVNYFNSKGTGFNVFECGKGAKYDDVNNVPHEYAVINSIFLEHTRELGSTLTEIAGDKAHVITGGQKCVYTAGQSVEVLDVIRDRAAVFGTPVKIYGRDFGADNIRYTQSGMLFDVWIRGSVFDGVFKDLCVPLLGEHQTRNCALAMAVCMDVMVDPGIEDRRIGAGSIETAGIDAVRGNLLRLDRPGRMEVLSASPFMMLDACINAASCADIKQVLAKLGIERPVVVIGIPDDKDFLGVAKEMSGISDGIILTKSQNPHYVFTDAQLDVLNDNGIKAILTHSVGEAVHTALASGRPVVILGTTSVVSEVKKLKKA